MGQYNANTVIRQTSRRILEEFFRKEKCLQCINFQKDNEQEIKNAFMTLPDSIRLKLEVVMRNVFDFARSSTTLARLIDEIKQIEDLHIKEILDLPNNYDRAFFIYLHYDELWKKTCVFSQADNLNSRYWTRCTDLPQKEPLTDTASMQKMGEQISQYFMEKEFRGKKFLIDYQKRTENLHYYFIYLSDYANSYETWNENACCLEYRNESRPLHMVCAYDSRYGTLDTYSFGGEEKTNVLQKSFCNAILNCDLVDRKTFKSAFRLNQFKERKNILKSMPSIGVVNAKITSMELVYYEKDKRRTHRMSTGSDAPNDEIYNTIEHDMNMSNLYSSSVKVRFIRIVLDILVNGALRKMILELTANNCTLKSFSEELRVIGEKYIRESSIDVQPSLFE